MKLSLFTPTHDPRFLGQTWQSLKTQDADFEWVIVPNGVGLREDHLRQLQNLASQDRRIKVPLFPGLPDGVGALKRAACQACQGDAFVELDHDDMLTPGALGRINAAFEGGAGFVYSDSAAFSTTNEGTRVIPRTYTPRNGWQTYSLTAYGHSFTATKAFDLTPRSLCEVHYAPDHVRAWSRRAYELVGGHDASLEVADDHDLICRTYLSGADFTHTNGCDYLYRWHDRNTVQSKNQKIQSLQKDNRDRYVAALSAEWSRRHGYALMRINGVDELTDVLGLSDEKDDRVGQIVIEKALQYLTPETYVDALTRLHDLLAPGGFLHVSVPDPEGLWADQDQFHRLRFNANSFLHLGDPEFRGVLPVSDRVKFETVGVRSYYPSPAFEAKKMSALWFDLCALKGQNHPGPAHAW